MKRASFHRFGFRLSILTLLSFVILISGVSASAVDSSSEESATASVALSAITMRENTSYVSDEYFGLLHVIVGDDSVVVASIDSENRLVISAIGDGSTTVSFWYKSDSSSGWTSATLPVSVSGLAEAATTVSQAQAGIAFPSASLSLVQGQSAAIGGLKLNGAAVSASSLLWISSDVNVVTVDQKTGMITAVSSGSTTVFAIDPATKSCNGITVKVS